MRIECRWPIGVARDEGHSRAAFDVNPVGNRLTWQVSYSAQSIRVLNTHWDAWHRHERHQALSPQPKADRLGGHG